MKKHDCYTLVFTMGFAGMLATTSLGGVGEAFPIAATPEPEGCISAAFDGTNFLAGVQGNTRSHDGISWQRMSQTGELLGSRVDQGSDGGAPLIGFGDGIYLIVWDSAGDGDAMICGQCVNPAGTAIGSTIQISFSPGNTEIPGLSNVSFGNGKFLVVWQDYRAGDDSDVYGKLLAANGMWVGSEIPIAIDNSGSESGDDDDAEPSSAFDGTNFLVVFTAERRAGLYDGEDVYGQFVSPSGSLVGGNFVIDENDIPSPNPTATCWDGEKYTVLFHEGIEAAATGFEEQWDLYARFVSAGGTVATNRIAIATSPTDNEQFPSIAYDGTHYLVTATFMMGVSTNFPGGTNAMFRGRFFDRQLDPTTPWFTLSDPDTPGELPVGGAVLGNGKFAVGLSLLDGDFNFIDTYGVMVDSTPPEISSFGIQGGNATLSLTNLFPGTLNRIERNASLTTNNWIQAGEFFCTSPFTNWTGSISNEWSGMFYRLRME